MEELQPQTNSVIETTTEKITPDMLILSFEKKHKNVMTAGLIGLILLLPLAVYTNTHLYNFEGDENDRQTLTYINATINVLAFLSLLALFYGWIFLRDFRKGFNKGKAFPIYWDYPNGNFFILTISGIIYHNAVPQERIFKTTFEGITWTAEDIKDIIADSVKGDLSVGSFLPSLKFKSTSNFVQPYIPLTGDSELTVIFCESTLLRFLVIATKNNKVTSTIRIPLPAATTFDEEDFTRLGNLFFAKAKCKARFEYFDKHEMEQLLAGG